MTHNEFGQENTFARAILPWLVGGAALLVYVLTLNHWISLGGLTYVARATNEMWTPELTGAYGSPLLGPFGPVFYLVTYPIRWLPPTQVPLALNLFSALCGSLTLALLARSVALLPHDRTHEQRQREHSPFSLLSISAAWIPPVFAAIVCGLQLSFWESATAVSSTIFDVLLFAYVVRCVLEYRIVERDSWLFRAALVYGAAMTEDWLMIGLLPFMICALVWIKGISFFNLRFLRGMVLCGLIGLLFYLLLPVIYLNSDLATVGFWPALKVNLVAQKDLLRLVVMRMPKNLLLLLATTSLLPILLIGFRWASHFGDPSKVGIAVTTWILHLVHAAFLLACIWVAFDPVFSPRHKGLNLLSLYYLGALGLGYFIGYFLLVFVPLPDRMGQTSGSQVSMHNLARSGVVTLLVIVPLGLSWKNLPQIRMSNGSALHQFCALLMRGLPDRGVLLSDDSIRLRLAEAWINRHGTPDNYLFLDSQALSSPDYHEFQRKRHPKEWPMMVNAKAKKSVPDITLVRLVEKLKENNPAYYLHSSFGYYFEVFEARSHGMIHELIRYPTNTISPPALTAAEIADNEKFWNDTQPLVDRLAPFIEHSGTNRSTDFVKQVKDFLQIPFDANLTARILGRLLSHDLTYWGMELQRAGRLPEAAHRFETALEMNPDNLPARYNLQLNRDLQAGRKPAVQFTRAIDDDFGTTRSWQTVMRDEGPFDDPTHCFIEGVIFVRGRLYREGLQCFERVHQLVPDHLVTQVYLARFYANQKPEKSLSLLADIRSQPAQALTDAGIAPGDLAVIEATALFTSHKPDEAEKVLSHAMVEHPNDEKLLSVVVQVSTAFGRSGLALDAANRELEISPTNSAALIIYAYIQMQRGDYDKAIPALTRALAEETNNFALQYPAQLDRAIAYLRSDHLEEAQHDYETARKMNPNAFQVYYGLGEIAWRKKETNAAINFYRLYLSNSIPDSEEAKMIGGRLQSLQAASP